MSETMTIWHIALMLFVGVVLTANTVVMVRHIMIMRMMTMALQGFVEQQQMFNEFLDNLRRDTPNVAPE
ncbi:hypothetical protein [Bradyrhizobium ottawaense]|uniref:hypothetical protein n=1 Tax=Bradyrhizobium ottawaense TaxID=931866 RepID=UPI0030F3D115